MTSTFEHLRTGHAPGSVAVVLSEETLVVTVHGALSPAEKTLAQTPAGAAQVQEFHRQSFHDSADPLRREIKRITGVDVREATAAGETKTGTVVHEFTTGTMVPVFLLAHGISAAGSKMTIDATSVLPSSTPIIGLTGSPVSSLVIGQDPRPHRRDMGIPILTPIPSGNLTICVGRHRFALGRNSRQVAIRRLSL